MTIFEGNKYRGGTSDATTSSSLIVPLRISIRGCVHPSVRPSAHRSIGPSVPRYFPTTNMTVFVGKKSSNDIINNGTMSDDEVVASDVPPGTC